MVKGFAIEGTQAIYMFSSALFLVVYDNISRNVKSTVMDINYKCL